MDIQQDVLSSMLILQEKEYEKRLNAWTDEGKAAWDELLRLDIDDYVLINYPKKHKLNFNNLGPYKVVKMTDKAWRAVDASSKFSQIILYNRPVLFNRIIRTK